MDQTTRIGPISLQQDYLDAANYFWLLQCLNNLLLEQASLDVEPQIHAGLAFETMVYQRQMKKHARTVLEQTLPGFIDIFGEASAFYDVWQAAVDVDLKSLGDPSADPADRTGARQIAAELSKQAGKAHQRAAALAQDMAVQQQEMARFSSEFDQALETALIAYGQAAVEQSSKIDKLNAEVLKNIQAIVDGAHKTGKAVSDLLIGIITIIAKAKTLEPDKPDAAGTGKEGGKASQETGKDKEKAAEKEAQKKEEAAKPPSGEFVIKAVEGAAEGTAESAQARADLNHNNQLIAAAYQVLARVNEQVAVASAVKSQNEMFIQAVNHLQAAVDKIGQTWGRPEVDPPASGISREFAEFARRVEGLSGAQDTQALADQVEYDAGAWDLFNQKLTQLKHNILSSTPVR